MSKYGNNNGVSDIAGTAKVLQIMAKANPWQDAPGMAKGLTIKQHPFINPPKAVTGGLGIHRQTRPVFKTNTAMLRLWKCLIVSILLPILLLEAVSFAAHGASLYLPLVQRPFSRAGFGVWETSHGTIVYQDGVALTTAMEVGAAFEDAYLVVGQDLDYPEKRPRLFVYVSLAELLNDLIETWHYPEWFRTVQAIPRMNVNYEAWMPPGANAWFIGHEYSHRIIERIAGLNSQTGFKWFDEGLAEQEGYRSLAVRSPLAAETTRQNGWTSVKAGIQSGKWISLRDLTTESQWTAQMATPNVHWIYLEAAVALDYLIMQQGMGTIKAVLGKVGSGIPFPDAFSQVFSQTVDQFEAEFISYILSH